MEPDFSGYATKAGLKCSDGRTIMPDAFKHMDGKKVPLVWQHGHDTPENVLGHAILEARADGVYARGFFNDTPNGVNTKKLVQHGDITALSIYANQLVEKSKQVFHGMIRELSLVLSGANPGAFIDNVQIAHGDGDFTTLSDEAIISAGESLEHGVLKDEKDEKVEGDTKDEKVEHADAGPTVQDVYDSLTDDQKDVVHFMISEALQAASQTTGDAEHKDGAQEGDLTHKEGTETVMNVFDKNKKDGQAANGTGHVLSHDAVKGIVADAVKSGSLKSAVEAYAIQHGINDIDLLFPDAKLLNDRPEFNQRRMEWVNGVLNGAAHSPFSRVKTVTADITQLEARAKGYIKGEYKKEEWFGLTKRTTAPTTIYKKQKLDRDDVLDITDLDVVAWMKAEMQVMLKEELARAILIGDGRAVDDEDKVKDPIGATEGTGIRSILYDHELFVTTVNANVSDSSSSMTEVVDAILESRRFYKGSGNPTFYTTEVWLSKFMVTRDADGHRMWKTPSELAAELMVNEIVTVEPMEDEEDLIGIIVNLRDYNIGADKGGETTFFDDFDIDYNQLKYLIETRLSGALTKIKSALVIKSVAAGAALVNPITEPTFVELTGVVTIPTQTGVTYKNADTSATLSAGAQAALDPGDTLNVIAVPASASYYFLTNAEDEWSFTRPAA